MLGLGPHLILDKSVLEMLNGDEFSLLADYFRLVVPPVLIEEIVADLELKPTERRLPEIVVKRLANRMQEALGYECVHFGHAMAASLLGRDVPMFGQVPIGPKPNAYRTSDGKGFIYDQKPEQEFWERLAAGVFDASDVVRARSWRQIISDIDLQKMHRTFAPSAKAAFGPVGSCHDVLLIVDRNMENANADAQRTIICECAAFVGFNENGQKAILQRWEYLHRPKFRDFAPYAAYLTRLNLTFVMCVGTEIVTTRATNLIDLQYLYYVPFTMVFASADRLHETLWPASSGRNTFVHGGELKADLRERLQRRMSGKEPARRGFHPPRLDNSVITKAFDLYMRADEPQDQKDDGPRTIDELEPEIQENLKKVWEEIDKRKD